MRLAKLAQDVEQKDTPVDWSTKTSQTKHDEENKLNAGTGYTGAPCDIRAVEENKAFHVLSPDPLQMNRTTRVEIYTNTLHNSMSL